MTDRNNIEKAHLIIISDKNAYLDNLIWLGKPGYWDDIPGTPCDPVAGELYRKLVPEGELPTLRKAAERLIREYGDDSTEIFRRLSDAAKVQSERRTRRSEFFTGFSDFNAEFDLIYMGPLLVSSLRDEQYQTNGNPALRKDKLYIDDGNHRALIYATRVMCNDNDFVYMPALWSRSWAWLLDHGYDADSSPRKFPPTHYGWQHIKAFDPAEHDFIKTHRSKQKIDQPS